MEAPSMRGALSRQARRWASRSYNRSGFSSFRVDTCARSLDGILRATTNVSGGDAHRVRADLVRGVVIGGGRAARRAAGAANAPHRERCTANDAPTRTRTAHGARAPRA